MDTITAVSLSPTRFWRRTGIDMIHWSAKYTRLPWTDNTCCGYYFARIQAEVFGRTLDPELVGKISGAFSAARVMAACLADLSVAARYGYRPTDAPVDGDACFLTQRSTPHHIGTVAVIDGRFAVAHALEGVGMVVSDLLALRVNGWRIAGFWSWI